VEPRLVKASKISFSAGEELKVMFSSSEMTGEKRSSNSCSISELEEEKRLEKWEMKFPPISSLEDTQTPVSNFKKLTALALLLIKVEI
jgi:hypothetical protein